MPIVAINGTDACVVDDDRMCVVVAGVGVVGEDDVLVVAVVVVVLLLLVLVVSNMGAPAVNGLSVNTSSLSAIPSSMYTVCVCVCVGFVEVCTSCNNVYVLVVVATSLLSSKLKPNGCSTCCSLLL